VICLTGHRAEGLARRLQLKGASPMATISLVPTLAYEMNKDLLEERAG
jgi:hypothetical protein